MAKDADVKLAHTGQPLKASPGRVNVYHKDGSHVQVYAVDAAELLKQDEYSLIPPKGSAAEKALKEEEHAAAEQAKADAHPKKVHP